MMLTPEQVLKIEAKLNPIFDEYGTHYEVYPEDKLAECGIFVPSLIDTVKLLARELEIAHRVIDWWIDTAKKIAEEGEFSLEVGEGKKPDPVIQQWIEWAQKGREQT